MGRSPFAANPAPSTSPLNAPPPPSAAPAPMPGATQPRPPGSPMPRREPAERRTLVVGRGISVQGIVQDAERLVVEGTVEATMIHAQELSISPGGVFKGEVEVEDAEVAGTIDGTLTARGNLIVRATGRVLGTARLPSPAGRGWRPDHRPHRDADRGPGPPGYAWHDHARHDDRLRRLTSSADRPARRQQAVRGVGSVAKCSRQPA